jgi:hypothetical protein
MPLLPASQFLKRNMYGCSDEVRPASDASKSNTHDRAYTVALIEESDALKVGHQADRIEGIVLYLMFIRRFACASSVGR